MGLKLLKEVLEEILARMCDMVQRGELKWSADKLKGYTQGVNMAIEMARVSIGDVENAKKGGAVTQEQHALELLEIIAANAKLIRVRGANYIYSVPLDDIEKAREILGTFNKEDSHE